MHFFEQHRPPQSAFGACPSLVVLQTLLKLPGRASNVPDLQTYTLEQSKQKTVKLPAQMEVVMMPMQYWQWHDMQR
jgi:hypothetical protein